MIYTSPLGMESFNNVSLKSHHYLMRNMIEYNWMDNAKTISLNQFYWLNNLFRGSIKDATHQISLGLVVSDKMNFLYWLLWQITSNKPSSDLTMV